MPSWPMEMPSETEIVPNSSGKPPAARTPSLARLASRSSERLQGVISFQDDATPICGLVEVVVAHADGAQHGAGGGLRRPRRSPRSCAASRRAVALPCGSAPSTVVTVARCVGRCTGAAETVSILVPATTTIDSERRVTAATRRELAEFLALAPPSARSRAPSGCPPGGARRTPGLRREEVALLSGVSHTWYTWLEQGRDIRPSRQVVDALARTLRLSPAEHEYVLRLTGHGGPPPGGPGRGCRPRAAAAGRARPLPRLRDHRRLDDRRLEPGLRALLPRGRDRAGRPTATCCGWSSPTRRSGSCSGDWATDSRRFLTQFRAEVGPRLADPEVVDLVARLEAASPHFRAGWASHDVDRFSSGERRFEHPEVGSAAARAPPADPGRRPGRCSWSSTPPRRQRHRRPALADRLAGPPTRLGASADVAAPARLRMNRTALLPVACSRCARAAGLRRALDARRVPAPAGARAWVLRGRRRHRRRGVTARSLIGEPPGAVDRARRHPGGPPRRPVAGDHRRHRGAPAGHAGPRPPAARRRCPAAGSTSRRPRPQ